MRFSSPFYAFDAEIACCVILGIVVYGLYTRGLKSVTNLLLLIPLSLWGIEVAYADATWQFGLWPIALYGSTSAFVLLWMLVQMDHELHGK